MNKAVLSKELQLAFDKMVYLLHNQEDDLYDQEIIEGKWTTGQHIGHLIKSMKPVNTAMRVPKLLLSYKFGTCNRKERSFEEMVNKYEAKLEASQAQAPSRFTSDPIPAKDKAKSIEQLQEQTKKMIRLMNNWSEDALSKYVLPHPLLGKLSFREMVAFSILHMEHHRQVLKHNYMPSEKLLKDEAETEC